MERPQREIQCVGNLIFNKAGNTKEEKAWLKIKEYIAELETEVKRIKWENELLKLRYDLR